MISDGVELVVCDQCGDVTIRYESMIRSDLSREDFAGHSEEKFLKKLIDLIEQEDLSGDPPPTSDHMIPPADRIRRHRWERP